MIILPRQARDKHRESTQLQDRFSLGDDGGMHASYAALAAASVVRDITTSQVRFTRDERTARKKTRQQHMAERVKLKKQAEEARNRRSPLGKRQAERRAQIAARRAAEAAEAEEMAENHRMSASFSSTWGAESSQSGGGGYGSSSPGQPDHRTYMQRTWPAAAAAAPAAANSATTDWRYGAQADSAIRSVVGGAASQPWPVIEQQEAIVDPKLLRPGRTSRVDRQLGFGRPVERHKLRPIIARNPQPGEFVPSEESTTGVSDGQQQQFEKRGKRGKRRSSMKPPQQRQQQQRQQQQRRRRPQQQRGYAQRSASSMAALPPSRRSGLPERDSAWRQSTYDGTARLAPQPERTTPRVWYAEDETRRFIKGNIVKGALPPVSRPGPGSPSKVA